MMEAKKINFQKRGVTRRALLQALYSWELSKDSIAIVEQNCLNDYWGAKDLELEYFQQALQQIEACKTIIDENYSKYIGRTYDTLDVIEKSILRLATYELLYRLDVPFKVILNEAVELAKIYGSTDSHKFINSTLDKLAHELRVEESV